jgi:hypothetical protein
MSNEIEQVPIDRIKELQAALATMPQIERPTFHHFCNGMYIREMHFAAGDVFVGRIYREQGFFQLIKGSFTNVTPFDRGLIVAPYLSVIQPGCKRAGYVHEDCIILTVHRTETTDVEEAVRQISEPEEGGLYDAHNRLVRRLE